MTKDWPYAKMAQEAASAGGPEQWLELIKKTAYEAGASDMKNALIVPLLAAGVGLGALGVVGYQSIHKWIVEKKQESLITEQEAAEAEEYLKKELGKAIVELEICDVEKI